MLVVKKYGGTSLATPRLIRHVAANVALARSLGERVVLVVSAMAGETDNLINLAHEVCPGAHGRDFSVLMSSGERISAAITVLALQKLGIKSRVFSGGEAGIITDNVYQRARIMRVEADKLRRALNEDCVPVVMGFQGKGEHGDVTILDRGGSDDTAVWLSHALNADRCEIFTDVKGVYSTDPNICPHAKILHSLSFEEMMEMASLGAEVLQLHSVENAARLGVQLYVKHAHIDEDGTFVSNETTYCGPLTGVAFKRNNFWLKFTEIPHKSSFIRELLSPLRKMHIEVDMLARSLNEDNRAALSFIVGREDYPLAKQLLEETLKSCRRVDFTTKTDMARLSVIGREIGEDALLAKRIYDYLKNLDIAIHGISMTEMALTMLIENTKLNIAVNELHSLLGLDIVAHHY